MTPHPDAIADCVLNTFAQLPGRRKPRPRHDGSREWVPLAGIVLSRGDKLSCVSLGTGMKCLPASKLPAAQGNILHDWHAEVLAIRAFNRFLLDECLLISTPPFAVSDFVRSQSVVEQSDGEHQPFTLREDATIHMYCSEAPCGDASMELVMDAQEDATPWTSAPPIMGRDTDNNGADGCASGALRGRSNFSLLGAQATSLLSSTTATLISAHNAYLDSLVLPSSQYVPAACERAFSRSGRLSSLDDSSWTAGHRFQPFIVRPTSREFTWGRRNVPSSKKAVASNLSAVWTSSWQETLIGGVLQGRKQLDPRGASRISRRSMWNIALQIAGVAGLSLLKEILDKESYDAVKKSELLKHRQIVKSDMKTALKGWAPNTGDETFRLDPGPL
ncbi:hypothetical protein ACN47E_008772 [Coniothyrium glycines]